MRRRTSRPTSSCVPNGSTRCVSIAPQKARSSPNSPFHPRAPLPAAVVWARGGPWVGGTGPLGALEIGEPRLLELLERSVLVDELALAGACPHDPPLVDETASVEPGGSGLVRRAQGHAAEVDVEKPEQVLARAGPLPGPEGGL